MRTKIHSTVDALGNPTGFTLTTGQASDLDGADALVSQITVPTVIADKSRDAADRVPAPLRPVGKTAAIPPKRSRTERRAYDRALYQARHLIENFLRKLKHCRALATRYDKTARNFLAAVDATATAILLN